MNTPFKIQDETQPGTVVELLKLLPQGHMTQIKMCTINGRQVQVHDMHSDKKSFVPIKDPVERITCMTSASYMEK